MITQWKEKCANFISISIHVEVDICVVAAAKVVFALNREYNTSFVKDAYAKIVLLIFFIVFTSEIFFLLFYFFFGLYLHTVSLFFFAHFVWCLKPLSLAMCIQLIRVWYYKFYSSSFRWYPLYLCSVDTS